jgi:hypothetical protein
MTSQSPRSEREEERRLNVRTLTIASAASASAALVTSQLWIAGTWIAAALTPILVALIAEVLTRPTERISRALTSDRPAVFPADEEAAPPRVAGALERDPDAPRPRSVAYDRDAPRSPRPGRDDAAPVRVYRSGTAGPSGGRSRRKIAVGMVAATAAIAFVIAALLITVPELIAGQSIGQAERGTTLLGGTPRAKRHSSEDKQAKGQTTPTETTTAETETTTAPEQQPTTTTPTPTTPQTTTPAPQATTPQTQTTTPAP